MDGADTGMVERRGRPRFAFEALQRLRITPCGRNHCGSSSRAARAAVFHGDKREARQAHGITRPAGRPTDPSARLSRRTLTEQLGVGSSESQDSGATTRGSASPSGRKRSGGSPLGGSRARDGRATAF